MFARLALAAFLLAHAAIHAGFLSRPPVTAGGPAWPFSLDTSWLLHSIDPELRRLVGVALVAATIGGFGLAALGAFGIMAGWAWPVGVALGAVASLATLVLFFHPWLILGVVIDVVLLWAALIARWEPAALAS